MDSPDHTMMTPEELRILVEASPKTPDERYKRAISNLNASEDEYSRWCALGRAAKTSFEVKAFAEALGYAEELRGLIPLYEEDWNYGNAVQDSNIVFGLIALNGGDIPKAQDHLLAAGRSPGSPQMNSFGPNMTLAKSLIESGKRDSVLSYFELCRVFWKMHGDRLDEWKSEVLAGEMPDFGTNLMY